MISIKNIFTFTILGFFALVIFATPVTVSDFTFDMATVAAWGSGGTSDGGSGGGSGGDGCGGCGSTPTPTPQPPQPPQNDPKCEDPAANNTGGNLPCTYPAPTPTCESFAITQTNVAPGANLTFNWQTSNATNVSINGIGPVAVDGVNQTFTAPNTDGTYTYRLTFDGKTNASCVDTVIVKTTVVQPPTPLCLSFTGSKTTITRGESLTLNWNTANATQILINNAVGDVTDVVSKSKEVSPLADTTYNLTVIGAAGTTPDRTCNVPVIVTTPPTPTTPAIDIVKRDAIDKNDTQTVAVGGTAQFEIVVTNTGNENLVNVVVTDPLEPACNRTIGALAIGASETYTCNATNVRAAFTNIANVTGNSAIDAEVVTDTDPTNVLITSTAVFTCANNVTFNASDTSISRGQSTTLNWSTTNVDSLTITGLNTTALSGNQTVAPSNDTTYTLNATQSGTTIACPLSINVSTGGGGGGGGGSSTPRCELEISDKNITLGEEITVKWETSNATEVTLKDDRGRVLFTTGEFLNRDKQQYFDHSIKFKPTRNTTYTLVAERGSRDRECTVSVKLDDTIVLLQVRDQAPLVSGISLTQVPYTGFEAGPVMTIMFYMLLVTWALYITYVLVIPKTQLAVVTSNTPATRSNVDLMVAAEQVRPDVFAAMAAPTMATVPANLPVAMPVVAEVVDTNTIENQAHALHALISSDAVRTISGMTNEENQSDVVAKIVADAKGAFPLEDGWVVINQSRLMEITDTTTPVAMSAAPTGAGSLAEAIVTGNIVAAYQMIGTRPMVALADAAADLDALYRIRKGADAQVSDLLESETANLADEQIADMIAALTGALDGTYSDEAAAVKMAIMKAVKVAA
jgi:uncharacterized repeat protein (TIGR01451 family)